MKTEMLMRKVGVEKNGMEVFKAAQASAIPRYSIV